VGARASTNVNVAAVQAPGQDLEAILGQRELVTLHSGSLYRITLSAERARYAEDSRAFERTLRAWRWTE
jgi:hypothetical protein